MRCFSRRVLTAFLIVGALFVLPQLTFSQAAAPTACNQPTAEPVVDVPLPGHPFMALASDDGCWIFVSMRGAPPLKSGVAVVQRSHGKVTLLHVVPLGNSSGMVFSHDGKLLLVTDDDSVAVLDLARVKSGQVETAKLGRFYGGAGANDTNVNISPDDRLVFASDHAIPKETTSVYRLDKARAANFQGDFKVGTIHAGREVLAIIPAHDNRYMYIVAEQNGSDSTWSAACPQNPPVGKKPVEGVVNLVDVERAGTDPAHAILARVKAGCVSTRMALSPKGDRLYVTARADDALVVLDTTKFLSDPDHAKIATVPVGKNPTGISLMDGGKRLVVTNIGVPKEPQALTVIDAAKVTEGSAAVVGTIPVGIGPRDASITKDGHTLYVPNFDSDTLRLVDLTRLHMDPPK